SGGLLLRHQLAIARRASGAAGDGSRAGGPGGGVTADPAKIQREMADVLGAGDPNALAAMFSLAIDRAGRSTSRALALAGTCHRGFADHFSADHPFVWLCQMAVGAFTLDDGRAAEGLDICAGAADGLGARLGPTHPWTLAAELHLARAHGVNGRYDTAGEVAAGVVAKAAELLGSGHPVHRTARAAVEAADRGAPLPVHHVDVPCT
ncbi:hypothetical protein DZF91_35505, partial [Actinomadura logoneensis]